MYGPTTGSSAAEGPTERQERRKRHFFGPKIATQALYFTGETKKSAVSYPKTRAVAWHKTAEARIIAVVPRDIPVIATNIMVVSQDHYGSHHEHYGSFPGILRQPPRTLRQFHRNITVVTAKTTVVAHERGKSPSHAVSVARARDIELDLHLCCRCYTRPVRLSLCVRAC